MIEWIELQGSSMMTAAAFVQDEESIYIRFNDGKCWRYSACSTEDWHDFMAPGQSRGKYFHAVLKHRPGTPFDG